MKITDFSVKHPVIISILLVALILFGFICASLMSQEFFAQVEMPELLIMTAYPGASAEDVEQEVSSVIEDELSGISGINTISSTSYDSLSAVGVQFNYEVNITEKIGDVREKLNNVKDDLPAGAETPQTLQFSSSALPVFTFAIESTMDAGELDSFIDDTIIPRLSRINGVAQCTLVGSSEQEVTVTVRHEDLAALGLDLLTVYSIVQAQNSTLPAGKVRFQEEFLNIRLSGEYTSLDDIKNLVVGAYNGVFITLSDIADVEIARQPYDTYVTQGSNRIQIINIMKQQGADTVSISSQALQTLSQLERESNNALTFTVINDDSYNIRLSINSLRNSALLGALLAVFVIFLFLHNVRSTLIIAVSLPCSVLIAFCAMAIKGQGINLMTLGGLTVAVGMIVDNSIVVLENIYRHYMKTLDAKKAASVGTAEVGGSIIASTATTLVVFIPILFLQDLTGKILSDVALTIIWAIASSMISALVVVPFLSAYLLRPVILTEHTVKARFIARTDAVYTRTEKLYTGILRKALNNRRFVVFFAVLLLALSVVSGGMLGFEFLSESDMNEITITFTFNQNHTLEDTENRMKEIDVFIRSIVPEIETTAFTSGVDSSMGFIQLPNTGYARIKLVTTSHRERSVFDIINVLNTELPKHFGGVEIKTENGGLAQLLNMATGGGGFMIELYGNDLDDLYTTALSFASVMEEDQAVTSVHISSNFDKRELVTSIAHDRAGVFGIQTQNVTALTRILFTGLDAGTYRSGSDLYPITVKSDLANATITQNVFDTILLPTLSGNAVPLSTVASMDIQSTVNQISKSNRMRTITLQAQLSDPDLRSIQNRLLPKLNHITVPSGIDWEIAGSASSMTESFSSLALLMCISAFLVYMVMVIQFERFIQPLIVMVSIPFAFIGIVASLTLFNTTLSLLSMLGIIALIGTVVNTAIVLIDYINLLRTSYKMSLYDALVTGCTNRLRPILMSVCTTVMGLIPMIFSIGEGSALTAPLAQAIFGGLLSSTFITLIFIPVLYYSAEYKKAAKQEEKDVLS